MVERTLISFPSQLQLIERLQHLLYLSSSMVFISGEQGSGKSTLVEQLSNQLPNNTQQAFISLSEATSAKQMRQLIVSQLFEYPLFDADDTLTDILLLLKKNQEPDIARVIVIDNAKLLPEEFLNELANVIKQKSLLSDSEINFIFLSEEENNKQMVSAINKTQNNQDIATLTFKLAPLNTHEAKQLLNHSFSQVGYSPKIQHKDAMAKQLSNCNGIPEKILSLATELSSGELEFDSPSWFRTRLPAILLMLFLVAIASSLVIYLFPQFIKEKVEVEAIVESSADLPEEIKAVEQVIEVKSEVEPTENLTEDVTEELAGKWPTKTEQVDDNPLKVGEADSEDRVTLSEQELLEISASEENINEPFSKQDNSSTFPETELDSDVVEEFAQIDVPVVEKPVALVVKPIIEPKPPEVKVAPEVAVTESPVQATDDLPVSDIDEVHEVFVLQERPNKQSVVQVDKTIPEVMPIESTYEDLFTPVSTLLAVNKNMFTLQLSGMSTQKSLQEFIVDHQLPRKDVYLYQTWRDKKPWYVFIYGQFGSRNAAKRAANNLPGSLKGLNSWVKEFTTVHQELQLNEQ